jgi:hypothetical protein
MLTITIHKGNANQNHTNIPSSSKTSPKTCVAEDVGKNGPSYTTGGNASWCNHYGKKIGLLKNLIIDLPYDVCNPTPGDIPKGMQHRLLQRHLHTHVYCSAIHNSQVLEITKMSHY